MKGDELRLVEAFCVKCGAQNQVYKWVDDRRSRIEARFERLVERNCDVGAMAWDFDCLWILAEQAEDFLDGKRGK